MDQESTFASILDQFQAGDLPLAPLPVDGSARRFYRVPLGDRTAILIEGAEPPYKEVTEIFLEHGIPVPEIYAADESRGLVLEEDFGDFLLERYPEEKIRDRYRTAVDLIRKIQHLTPGERGGPAPFRRSLGPAQLLKELVFFSDHFLKGHLHVHFGPSQEQDLHAAFAELTRMFSVYPLRLAHRDYHSRNLLIRPDGRLGIVDHQDAQLAPPHYDLVSLVFDAYRPLPTKFVKELVNRFHGGQPRYPEKLFWRTGLQRCLKALGSFGYLAHEKKKTHFLKAIPQGLKNSRQCLDNADLPELRKLLSLHVPAWK